MSTPANIKTLRKYLENSTEFIEFRFLPKFDKIWIYFNDKLIAEHEGAEKLEEGIAYRTSDWRLIEIQKCKNPYEFVVKVNGKYLPNTKHHPKNKVSSLYFLYMAVLVLGIFSTALYSAVFRHWFIISYQIVYLLSLGSTMVGLYIGNKYFFYAGLAFLIFDTLLAWYGAGLTMQGSFWALIWLVFKIYVIVVSFTRIKHVHEYHNYRVSLKKFNYDGEVIDV